MKKRIWLSVLITALVLGAVFGARQAVAAGLILNGVDRMKSETAPAWDGSGLSCPGAPWTCTTTP